MLFIKFSLIAGGLGLLGTAAAMLAQDYRSGVRLRLRAASRFALAAIVPLLVGLSIVVVPAGYAGVRISQISGTLPGVLYPGAHWIPPLTERVELFDIRDHVYSTGIKKAESLRVQTKEGLSVALAVTVRYKLDATRLPFLYSNLPQPVDQEIVPPVVASAFRENAPRYTVREVFATRRDEMARTVAGQITRKLAADGIIVKEVMLRDIDLPAEYAKGMEGLLLKEQENERFAVELEVKQKAVKAAELEAEAQKVREVKQAEARAQVVVLEAKAQADAMQHTLPLKEKQIQQSRLEAEARKEATVKNAEAMASAKVIDSKAELEKRKLMTEGESDRIRHVAEADAQRMRLEADVLKQNPLLIQKIIAEKLSDKVQIMMVPNDGKFFFANDVLRAAGKSE
jgi:regulator of protease activity HflC (stomatin/prohibitin superfamily)